MFLSAHYAGEDLCPKFEQGEPWKKVFGPVFIYLNSVMDGSDPLTLWDDAKNQVVKCSVKGKSSQLHLHALFLSTEAKGRLQTTNIWCLLSLDVD